jgi:hypothetical protein
VSKYKIGSKLAFSIIILAILFYIKSSFFVVSIISVDEPLYVKIFSLSSIAYTAFLVGIFIFNQSRDKSYYAKLWEEFIDHYFCDETIGFLERMRRTGFLSLWVYLFTILSIQTQGAHQTVEVHINLILAPLSFLFYWLVISSLSAAYKFS